MRPLLFALLSAALLSAETDSRMLLRQGWFLQSSAEVHENGSVLSTASFRPSGWYQTTVPTTVFSALVAAKKYPDPNFGMNLREVPGVKYNIGTNFSNTPMPADSPFHRPWWFRAEFQLPAGYRGKTVWLGFDGINPSHTRSEEHTSELQSRLHLVCRP